WIHVLLLFFSLACVQPALFYTAYLPRILPHGVDCIPVIRPALRDFCVRNLDEGRTTPRIMFRVPRTSLQGERDTRYKVERYPGVHIYILVLKRPFQTTVRQPILLRNGSRQQ